MVSSFLFISARTSRKSVLMIVGVGITHFVNQVDTLILINFKTAIAYYHFYSAIAFNQNQS